MSDTDLDRIHRTSPSFKLDTVLQVTGKCKLFSGELEGKPAIAKLLVNTDRQWIERFRHEIRFYRLIDQESTPVSIPTIYAVDEQELLIVQERVAGSPLATGRYLEGEIDIRSCESLLGAIKAVSEWRPWPSISRQDALASFQTAVAKGVTEGLVATQDYEVLLHTVNDLDWAPEFSHGDLLPGNCILGLDGHTLTLVDWEYAEYRLPGYDLALTFLVSFRSDNVRNAIREVISGSGGGRRRLFLANLAALLLREVRILQQALHVEGFPERQIEMSNLLEDTWERLRSAAHGPDSPGVPGRDAC